ncbi:odorant receptor 94a-like [Tribolium madens]|uniref:odorant receptor 94a-like n=1 Tax=Tribolium madens TaxID=41895 RepID=UPI001CF74638|nr:odorant receptor 94a-like [Tribolium madens]
MMLIVPVFTFQFANTIMYFCCMMIQLGMYCWYGHEIITTSDEIGQYFGLANWYDSSLEMRKDFAIFLERAKRPITLTAGGFVVLSLTTFTRILRSAYSYFAVLEHLYKKLVITIIASLITIAQFLSMVMQIIIAGNDLTVLSETLLFFMTHLTYMCKLVNLLFYKTNLLHIEDLLTRPKFYGFSQNELKNLKEGIESTKTVAKLFRIFCALACIAYGLVPYLDNTKAMALPLPGWLPYDTTKYYYQTCVFQMVAVSITASINSTIDILTWKLITIAAVQFDILKRKLRNLDFNLEAKLLQIQFKNCVKHHKEIVNYIKTVEQTFSKGIFFQFFASVIIICFTGFLIIITPVLSMQFLYLILYFTCMLSQVAIYCWYGHYVMTTSKEIGQDFYMSNWYESDVAIRKDLIIFMERVKKPIMFTAGNFITLSLITLTIILRSSYSYVAVLQHLYNKS